MMEVVLIAAVSSNGVIGVKNDLPWHIPDDLKRFKALTSGHPVIMGRKTFDSIFKRLGKPLPNRTNIIITRQNIKQEGAIVCNSIQDAIKEAEKVDNVVFVIGGEQIFIETLNFATKLELTEVFKDYEGDAFFPSVDKGKWKEISRERKKGDVEYDFVTYVRK